MRKAILIAALLWAAPAYAQLGGVVTVVGPELMNTIRTARAAVSTYGLMRDGLSQIQNMPARYRAEFSSWERTITAPNTYGNLVGWNTTATTGALGSGYQDATTTLRTYTAGDFARMSQDMQSRVKSRVGGIELQDAANENALRQIGDLRSKGQLADQQLGNLDADTLTDGVLASQTQIAQKQAVASVMQAHLASDQTKMLTSIAESLVLQSKAERDEKVNAIATDATFRANVANYTQSDSNGLGAAFNDAN